MSSYQIPPHVKLQSYANVIISISGRTAAAIIPVADKNQSLERKAGGCLALKIVLSTGAAPAAAYILYFSNYWLTDCLDAWISDCYPRGRLNLCKRVASFVTCDPGGEASFINFMAVSRLINRGA